MIPQTPLTPTIPPPVNPASTAISAAQIKPHPPHPPIARRVMRGKHGILVFGILETPGALVGLETLQISPLHFPARLSETVIRQSGAGIPAYPFLLSKHRGRNALRLNLILLSDFRSPYAFDVEIVDYH